MDATESVSPRYRGLDAWSDSDILDAFWEGQARAIAAVRPAIPSIAAAAQAVARRLRQQGRIIYAGAGSSGRQAALDGMELGSTFGWPDHRVAFILAEGPLLQPAPPGAVEDDAGAGVRQAQALGVGEADVLVAVAASGTTAFTRAAAETARGAGALVVAIANNGQAPLLAAAHYPILLETGTEVISGSTRMNAGTAHKAALGLLSSLAMTRLGHVHDGLMVSLRAENAKLRRRAVAIVSAIAGCSTEVAETALDASGGRIKPAVLSACGAAPSEAAESLAAADGHLRLALHRLARPE